MATRYAIIPEIQKGVVFSDPWYKDDVWCQYRHAFQAKDWMMQLDAKTEDGTVYFQMKLGRPTACHGVKAIDTEEGGYRLLYPGIYQIQDVEIGMDTARIFCGTMENWDMFGESGALHTGTDGFFGDLMVFTCEGEDHPAGFLLMGVLDKDFGNEEEIFKHMNASFNGQEISQELYQKTVNPNSMQYKLHAAQELQHAKTARKQAKAAESPEPER